MNGQTMQTNQPSEPASPRRDRSPDVMALDNLIRRKLRVSDPTDAAEVATALGQLYTSDKEALDREAAGLPFLALPAPAGAPRPATSTSIELEQAQSDVDRDLTELTTNSLLKDIQPELKGWAAAIRRAIADGVSAARFALDPRQRDRAFGVRRLLGDYARVARFVGALTGTLSPQYRRLAQSLDEVASVLLVLMGDALASIGFGGVGRFLLQVPASELQERRDAVIYALRNLIGSTQQAYGPNDWPRGLVAYQQFRQRLEESGHADLVALFQENTLARLMDDLIDRAASTNADGLRALGSTAQLGVESLRRLLIMGQFVVSPSAPPLAAFFSAIRLFLDPFEDRHAATGYRLLFISRPPVVFYGLYGIGGPDTATRRLLNLLTLRNRLAEMLDCYLGCDCGVNRARCQILLDKILYDVDRAIDLYALGADPEGDGQPERRAAAHGFVIDQFVDVQAPAQPVIPIASNTAASPTVVTTSVPHGFTTGDIIWIAKSNSRPTIDGTHTVTVISATTFSVPVNVRAAGTSGTSVRANLYCFHQEQPCGPPDTRAQELEDLLEEIRDKILWYRTFTLSTASTGTDVLETTDASGNPVSLTGFRNESFANLGSCLRAIEQQIAAHEGGDPALTVTIPESLSNLRNMLAAMEQELCIQRDAELQWENLLHTMAPSCIRFGRVFTTNGEPGVLTPVTELIEGAIMAVTAATEVDCRPPSVSIPPHFETSLDSIVDDVFRTGENRP